jgi:cobalt transporter subunit CbtB
MIDLVEPRTSRANAIPAELRRSALAGRLALLAAATCGLGLLWVVGFSEIPSLHNIAHDTRHSTLFPCH